MSDIRFDPVTNLWVVIARNRHERPIEFVPSESRQQQLLCPFCIGNEEETPPARASYRPDGTSFSENQDSTPWAVRVVPNKYPMYPTGGKAEERKRGSKNTSVSKSIFPYQSAESFGEQEVIICSPRHVDSLSELNDEELLTTFAAFQDRIQWMAGHDAIRHAMLFLNCRSTAGASLSHLHAQLIGSPIVSDELGDRAHRNEQHHREHGKALIESCAIWELEQRSRIIYQSENFCVFCPYASRFPFQVWLVPKHSIRSFVDCPVEMRNELARSCRWLISALETIVDQPGYNLLLHQAPFAMSQTDHWYFEIIPRLTRTAGYEWGTNIWVNPVSPETAAKRLRMK